jgi:hypothetical protein
MERNGVVVQAKMIEELLKEKDKLSSSVHASREYISYPK